MACNNNKSNNFEDIHGHLLTLQSVSPSGALIVPLNDSIEPANIKDSNQLGEPCKPYKPCVEDI